MPKTKFIQSRKLKKMKMKMRNQQISKVMTEPLTVRQIIRVNGHGVLSETNEARGGEFKFNGDVYVEGF